MHPESIKRIGRMELRARYIVEGFLSGMHRSPYFGQSVEFLQHREYHKGDELRHIDWKVWAKQDKYFIKQYEAETNMRVTLLVDVSKSMTYGRGHLNKYDYACTAATSLAYLVLRQQDAASCIAFADSVRGQVPMRSKRDHLFSIMQILENSSPREKTDLFHILRNCAELTPRRGMMILISDLLTERPGLFKGLKLLRQRGHDVMVLHLLDDDELDFPFNGPSRFEGLETDDRLTCNPRALRQGYLDALQAYLDEVRVGCVRNTCDYQLIRTSDPLDAALATYLSNRLGMHHHN
ncbi:MAG: DUF58 domain-containing protein [Pirellulales bacterium]|nr:DUF58 domain-containing protein [Pirellulales bacterium]